jgi:hypothetical protein
MEIALIFAGSFIFFLLTCLVSIGNEGGKLLGGLTRVDLGRPSRLDAVFFSVSAILFIVGLVKVISHFSISLH